MTHACNTGEEVKCLTTIRRVEMLTLPKVKLSKEIYGVSRSLTSGMAGGMTKAIFERTTCRKRAVEFRETCRGGISVLRLKIVSHFVASTAA